MSLTDLSYLYTIFSLDHKITLLLEFLLHYLTRPPYHIHVREALYLDNGLDLF